jgi:hypothetical protein
MEPLKLRLAHLLCFLLLIIPSFTSAASVHGHRRQPSQGTTSDLRSDSTKNTNGTPFSLSMVAEERAKVQQRQRNIQSISDRPCDWLGTEQRGNLEGQENREMGVWMQYTTAVLALGLVLGAELVG